MTDDRKESPLSLGEALPAEIARVRDEVMPMYTEIGPSGIFALTMMRASLDAASKAMIEGDTVAMIQAYKDLQSYHV